jgi:signal transduction histidine kinase
MKSRQDLLGDLDDPHYDARLAAARSLVETATPADADAIRQALSTETVHWVRRALEEALDRIEARPGDARSSEVGSALADRLEEETYSRAMEDITGQLSHEFSPLIGAVDYLASREVPDYASSDTAKAVSRLRNALTAIRALSKASAPPVYADFALSEVLRDVVATEESGNVVIVYSGRDDLVVRGDCALVELAISNGLRNAIEATIAAGDTADRPILIAWGDTDLDYWVTIHDRAGGLPTSYIRAFELGVTNKPNHAGMGLAIAQRAASSLDGFVRLKPAQEGATLFELRWSKEAQGAEV